MKWWDQMPWSSFSECWALLSSFTFIKRLFSSSSVSAIRVMSSAYLKLSIFLLAILIPACASSSPAFLMMYSAVAAASKSLQSCLTLYDPTDSCLPGSSVPGILKARILEWVAISFSNAGKWKVKVKTFSCSPPSHTTPTSCYRALALGALPHTSNSHWLSVLHMVIYMFQCYSLKSSYPLLLPLSPKFCSLCLCLLCCPACRIISTIFLNSIHMH